ncbi:phenol hydroxylase subunit P4 [Zavarzinia compransoris]|uniref:Phenol hydroxylase n=1 Tax=Zavarzinia compransoris TaxID=1264899 RepID=A0A317E7X7_9PROT|nr:phenol hydroxylase subunit P4 [Zavarzinia compransoris]PWR23177.1 phenol hydroxylase [Zavarzinia compransoris]TDP46265.1 phenol 2-monooxygenase P4 subunit [Zavarzinia compransoris]
MAVAALAPYEFQPRDLVENFAGKQLVYVSWDRHLLFAAPFLICLPPETPFQALVDGPLAQLLALDPDAAAIDWRAVEWLKAGKPFTPDFGRTLAENGIGHKTLLRFQTPGLNSVTAAA